MEDKIASIEAKLENYSENVSSLCSKVEDISRTLAALVVDKNGNAEHMINNSTNNLTSNISNRPDNSDLPGNIIQNST